MNSKITLMAVVLAIGAAMIIATPNAASALPPKKDTETVEPNDSIDVVITTTCANPSERNGPQSDNCPNERFETVECDASNPGGGSPKGHEKKECPEGS